MFMCLLMPLMGSMVSWCDSLPVTHIKCNAIPCMIMIPVYNGNCSCSHRRFNYVYMISIAREYITMLFVIHLKTAECQRGKATYKKIRLEKMTTHSPLDQVVTAAAFNTLRPRQDGRHFPTTFLNAFSWMKMFKFRLRFHRSLFPRVQLTIFQHWFR